MKQIWFQHKGNFIKKKIDGISTIEVLIMIVILALLLTATMFGIKRHLAKARDAKRKGHLNDIRNAFAHYYDDNGCYPPRGALEDCGVPDASHPLDSYLDVIPCDPVTGQPYAYYVLDRGSGPNPCIGYRVLTNLADDSDPKIERVGCSFDTGCGGATDPQGNFYDYGIVVGAQMDSSDWVPFWNP